MGVLREPLDEGQLIPVVGLGSLGAQQHERAARTRDVAEVDEGADGGFALLDEPHTERGLLVDGHERDVLLAVLG